MYQNCREKASTFGLQGRLEGETEGPVNSASIGMTSLKNRGKRGLRKSKQNHPGD